MSSRYSLELRTRGYTHHASTDEAEYEIASDETDCIAMHKGAALRKADF